jgi:hypothetical protein
VACPSARRWETRAVLAGCETCSPGKGPSNIPPQHPSAAIVPLAPASTTALKIVCRPGNLVVRPPSVVPDFEGRMAITGVEVMSCEVILKSLLNKRTHLRGHDPYDEMRQTYISTRDVGAARVRWIGRRKEMIVRLHFSRLKRKGVTVLGREVI